MRNFLLAAAVIAAGFAVTSLGRLGGFSSGRYFLLPLAALYAFVLLEAALWLRRAFPDGGRRIFRIAAAALFCFSAGKLLHLNPYRLQTMEFARLIRKISCSASSPAILTFDKHASRYRYYSHLPVVQGAIRHGVPHAALLSYLSFLAEHHAQIDVIWTMKANENCPQPLVSAFFPGRGEWRKIAESPTTHKGDVKRCVYCYTFSDEIRKNIMEVPHDFSVEKFPEGAMERSQITPANYCLNLGAMRKIPFFRTVSREFPCGIDLLIHRCWQAQSESEIRLTEQNVISGKRSLFFASKTPALWIMRNWVPVRDAVVSFDAVCAENTEWQIAVQGRRNGEVYQRLCPADETFSGQGKLKRYVFYLTVGYLAPADEFRVGVHLLRGACTMDDFSVKMRPELRGGK